MVHARHTTAAGVAVLACLLGSSPAHAARAGDGTCRGSLVAVHDLGGTVEPVVANRRYDPCRVETAGPQPATAGGAAGSTAVAAGSASTFAKGGRDPAEGDTWGGRAQGSDVLLTGDGHRITAEQIAVEARVECRSGAPVLSSTSTVTALTVDGQRVEVPDGGEPLHYSVANGVLHVNAEVTTANGVQRRALWFQGMTADVVAGEARAGVVDAPCQDAPDPAPKTPPPPSPWSCRASAVKLFAPHLGVTPLGALVEPAAANPGLSPCRSRNASRATMRSETRTGATASATTHVTKVLLTRPGIVITADLAAASARGECVGGELQLTGSSRVAGLHINAGPYGHSATDLFPGQQMAFPLPGGARLFVNYRIDGPDRVTRRALWLDTVGTGDLVVGEATVGRSEACPA